MVAWVRGAWYVRSGAGHEVWTGDAPVDGMTPLILAVKEMTDPELFLFMRAWKV